MSEAVRASAAVPESARLPIDPVAAGMDADYNAVALARGRANNDNGTVHAGVAAHEAGAATAQRHEQTSAQATTDEVQRQQRRLAGFDARHPGPLTARQQAERDAIEQRITQTQAHGATQAARHGAQRSQHERYVRHGSRPAEGEIRLFHSPTELDALNAAASQRLAGQQGMGRNRDGSERPFVLEPSTADRIRADRQYGRTAADRDLVANQYQGTVDRLVADGAEVAQAELVANLELVAADRIQELTGQFISRGMPVAEAQSKASRLHAKAMNADVRLIRENNVMTLEEFEQVKQARRAEAGRPAAEAGPTAEEREALERELQAERQAVIDTRDRYAQLTAEQRNGNIGRLGERADSLWRRIVSRVTGNRAPNARHEQLDARVERARNDYRTAFARVQSRAIVAAEDAGGTPEAVHAGVLDLKIEELTALENRIQEIRAEDGNKTAESWTRHGRLRRGARVALPALAVGAAVGVPVGILGAPIWATMAAGAGVALLGRRIGQRIAGRVNRGRAATEVGQNEQNDYLAAAIAHIRTRTDRFSHTNYTEQQTIGQVESNRRRSQRAGMIGSLAAGAGFLGGVITGTEIGQALATPGNTPSGTEAPIADSQGPLGANPVSPNTIPSGVDVHSYPWTVAHNMGVGSGNEMSTLSHLNHAMNQAGFGGGHWHLQHVGDTVQVYHGSHALNAAQQAAYNNHLVSFIQTGKF